MIYEIRRRYLVQKQTITDIAKDMGLSRPAVRKHIHTVDEPKYKREQTAAPKFDPFLVDSENGKNRTISRWHGCIARKRPALKPDWYFGFCFTDLSQSAGYVTYVQRPDSLVQPLFQRNIQLEQSPAAHLGL